MASLKSFALGDTLSSSSDKQASGCCTYLFAGVASIKTLHRRRVLLVLVLISAARRLLGQATPKPCGGAACLLLPTSSPSEGLS